MIVTQRLLRFVKGVLAPPFYRVEKPLPVRRAEAKNVYLATNTYASRTRIKLGLLDNLLCLSVKDPIVGHFAGKTSQQSLAELG